MYFTFSFYYIHKLWLEFAWVKIFKNYQVLIFIFKKKLMTQFFLGTLISVLSRSITEAIFVGLGTFVPLIVISGTVWPIQGMPTILKYISYFTPPTVPIESLRAVLYKGWGIQQFVVFKGLLTSIGFSLVFTSLSMLTIKFEKK